MMRVTRNPPIFVFLLLLPRLVSGAFGHFGKDARPIGMGEAFVGVADDVSALYYNPAGTTQIQEPAFSAQLSQMVRGVDDDSNIRTASLGVVQPLKGGTWGTLGFSYSSYKASALANERLLLANYARKLSLPVINSFGKASVGINIKNMRREYEADQYTENAINNIGVGSGQADPLFANNGFSKDVFSADLGALYEFDHPHKYSAGFSVTNVNQPDASLGGTDDRVPTVGRLGLSMRPNWGLIATEFRRTKRLSSRMDTELALGVERNFSLASLGKMVLRGGYVQGSRERKLISTGLSFQLNPVQLDYGVNFPFGELTETGVNHRLGFSFRWGNFKRSEKSVSLKKRDVSEMKTSLIEFSSGFQAAQFTLNRPLFVEKLSPADRGRFLSLLTLKYKKKGEGLTVEGWEDFKKMLLHEINEDDKGYVHAALEYWMIGNEKYALTFLGLVSKESKETSVVLSLRSISLAELEAKAFRDDRPSSVTSVHGSER